MNRHGHTPVPGRQRGAILIMYVFMLMLILVFAGFALDLGLAYYRKAQLQAAADSIAITAARSLNGTAAGLVSALSKAGSTAKGAVFGVKEDRRWNPKALRFAATPDAPDGEWKSLDQATPLTALYARVDLSELEDDVHMVEPLFMRILGITDPLDVAAVAVAGPTALQITPLAVCALNTTAAASRPAGSQTELVTYGFRQGVTYNLLKLNPQLGADKGAYFLVDPLAAAGPDTIGTAGMDSDGGAAAVVAPFMCAGKIARVNTGGTLRVRRLGAFSMAPQINSRLTPFTDKTCVRSGAPPDTNVKTYEKGNNVWQAVEPAAASAATVQGPGRPMSTIADQPPAPGQTVGAADYGILWAYGPASKTDGSSFAKADWPTLYMAGVATSVSGYPYIKGGPNYAAIPTGATTVYAQPRRERRLMHIPLLKCDTAMPTTTATVLAYGRFFLPALASADEVPGEFAGLAPEAALKTDVEIFR